MAISWHYSRPELAKTITKQLTSGLFSRIAYFGQRRIGKTTFVLKDLVPELIKQDCVPVYISMWGNISAPHHEFINKLGLAVNSADKKGAVNAVIQAEITKLNVLGVGAEFGRMDPIAAPDDAIVTIGNLMKALVKAHKNKQVVIIIDEIQHLVTATEFQPLQYAFRTILDELNDSICVFYTGSSRKGMEAMFSNKDMPFYNSASLVAFPRLDLQYVKHMASMLEEHFGLTYDIDALNNYFEKIDYSAFWFDRLIKQLALEQGPVSEAIEFIDGQIAEFGRVDNALSSLELLHMALILRISKEASCYGAEAKLFYSEIGVPEVDRGKIQSALKTLQRRRIITRVADVTFVEEVGLVEAIKRKLMQ